MWIGSPLIREKAFALLQACWEVGSRKSATVGRSSAPVTASPANDAISPLVALMPGEIIIAGRGTGLYRFGILYSVRNGYGTDEIITMSCSKEWMQPAFVLY